MIVGGWIPQYNVSRVVQIIDLINPAFQCKWNHVRAARVSGSSIGNRKLSNQSFFIFYGQNLTEKVFNNGIILRSNEELQLIKTGRQFSSSIVLNETRLWVSGGRDKKGKCTNSSEFISLDQPPEDGPKLPFTVTKHCMVWVDSKSIYLIGGKQNGKSSEKTWIIDPTNNFEIKEGPKMNYARCSHSCATMRLNNKTFIVVVGGYSDTALKNMEILDTSLPTNNWQLGK